VLTLLFKGQSSSPNQVAKTEEKEQKEKERRKKEK
jgi:hypothetical protein